MTDQQPEQAGDEETGSAPEYPPPATANLRQDPDLAALFEINERLSALLRAFWRSGTVPIPQEGLHPAQFMTAFSAVKAYKTHRAILILCQEGYGEDALNLLRSLFEVALGARYVARDPFSERAQRWLDYDAVERYELHRITMNDPYFSDYVQQLPANDPITSEIEEGARSAQQRWRFWRRERDGRLQQPGSWTGKSVREIARITGWLSHYNSVYQLASVQVHGSVMASNQYLQQRPDGGANVSALPSAEFVGNILNAAHVYLRTAAVCWAAVVQLPDEFRRGLAERGREHVELMTERVGPERAERARRAGGIQGDIGDLGAPDAHFPI